MINATRTGRVTEWTYADQDIVLAKGAEMGRFLLGSTIRDAVQARYDRLQLDWAPERPVRLGRMMGERAWLSLRGVGSRWETATR